MDIFVLAVFLWMVITLMTVAGVAGGAWAFCKWRASEAKKLYLGQCDVALSFPQFANPADRLNLKDKTVDGKKDAFEQYEWYVARLVYVLDECLALGPKSRWRVVAETQLANHKHYFGSEYYRKQGYLPHYRGRMRALIRKQQETG